MRIPQLLLIPFIAMLQGATMIDNVLVKDNTTSDLNQYVRSEVPDLHKSKRVRSFNITFHSMRNPEDSNEKPTS